MKNRSLHLVSALRLHSYPQADVRAAPHFFSSRRCHQSVRNQVFSSYCESMSPKQSDTVITRPRLRSLPLCPTATNVNEILFLHALPGSSFNRVYEYTAGVDEPFKSGKIPGMTEFHLTASTFEYSFKLHSRWKDNFNKEMIRFRFLLKIIFYHMNEGVHNKRKPKLF